MKQPKSLGDLLKELQKLSPEQLKKPIIYSSDEYCLSGLITNFGKAKADLYWNGGDDPSQLKTKKEWKKYGYDSEEITKFVCEIRKGDFIINF